MKKMTNWLVNIINVRAEQHEPVNQPPPILPSLQPLTSVVEPHSRHNLRDYPALLVEDRRGRKND